MVLYGAANQHFFYSSYFSAYQNCSRICPKCEHLFNYLLTDKIDWQKPANKFDIQSEYSSRYMWLKETQQNGKDLIVLEMLQGSIKEQSASVSH